MLDLSPNDPTIKSYIKDIQHLKDQQVSPKPALEWIIDQYQVKGESDPNREDDPGYIVRLVGQVTRVSVETMRIVQSLPAFLTSPTM